MFDVNKTQDMLIDDIDQLVFEIDTLWHQFTETRFFGNSRNFPNVHFGYMMTMFACVDLWSRYWMGRTKKKGEQTVRMVRFLDTYVQPGKHNESCVAVHLWRHALMHTGQGRLHKDRNSDDIYTWQLFFGPSSGIRHYELWRHPNDQRMVLSIVMTNLAQDLSHGLGRYLDDLKEDGALQATFQKEDTNIQLQTLDFQNCT